MRKLLLFLFCASAPLLIWCNNSSADISSNVSPSYDDDDQLDDEDLIYEDDDEDIEDDDYDDDDEENNGSISN